MTNHSDDTPRQVATFLLIVLEAVLKEQVKIKQLEPYVSSYILEAVKDQAIQMGWINAND